MTLNDIASILATSVCGPQSDRTIRILLTDSRSLTDPATTLFFALTTANNDGHRYIHSLYQRGVRAFVVSSMPDNAETLRSLLSLLPEASFIRVPDTLEALRTLAASRREAPALRQVVAVTGSRGKTLVKEWLYRMISPTTKAIRSPRSFNSRLGVPLSMWQIADDTQVAVIEAGISRPGEMQPARDLIRPTIGILTEITDEHAANFDSSELKLREKLSLFADCHTVVYCSDVPGLREAVSLAAPRARHVTYSLSDVDPSTAPGGFVNSYAAARAACRIITGSYPDTDPATLPLTTRMEVLEARDGGIIVTETFADDAPSLLPAIDFLDRNAAPGQRRVYLGPLTPTISQLLSMRGVTDGNSMSDTDLHGCALLVSGHRHDALVERLQRSSHQTTLQVNLDALVHNYNLFKSLLHPSTGVICMLKASGYGAGDITLARTLQRQGAAAIAVAAIDEGVRLREAGITMPIIVLNPAAPDFDQLFQYSLEPEIYNFDLLERLIADARRLGVSQFPVHIKLDTGMHRLGFRSDEIDRLISLLHDTDTLRPVSVFSHLCGADSRQFDDYTREQFDIFDRAASRLRDSFGQSLRRHILNTAGILRFPEHQYEMVRLGIGLYGVPVLECPSPVEAQLHEVSSLQTTVIAVRQRSQGDTIGYSRRGVITRPSHIATIPVGYADGINRRLGNGALSVIVRGTHCPTVGNVCMDAVMIDVTDVAGIRPGDTVEIFGPSQSVTALAEALGTIPYEVLTGISQRVRRVYYRE